MKTFAIYFIKGCNEYAAQVCKIPSGSPQFHVLNITPRPFGISNPFIFIADKATGIFGHCFQNPGEREFVETMWRAVVAKCAANDIGLFN